MAVVIDPEEKEIAALKRIAAWRGKRVLEIGCGDGRLSLRLARLGAQVEAIDPNPSLIHQARLKLPKQLVSQIKYEVGSAEALQHSAANFDLVVFSWSLC